MASADGYFYMFDINAQEGGVGKLITQASIYTQNAQLFTNNSLSSGAAGASLTGGKDNLINAPNNSNVPGNSSNSNNNNNASNVDEHQQQFLYQNQQQQQQQYHHQQQQQHYQHQPSDDQSMNQ